MSSSHLLSFDKLGVRLGLGVALALVVLLVIYLVGPTPWARADATSTSFSPAAVTLSTIGASDTITVSTLAVDATTDGVQINVQHSDNVAVSAPACVDIFLGGVPAGPTAVTGGTLIGCALVGADVTGPTGAVMTFVLTAVDCGSETLTFGIGGGFGTEFSDGGTGIGPGDTSSTVAVTGPSNCPPTAGDVADATAEDTLDTWTPVVDDPDAGDTLTCTADAASTQGGVATVAADCSSGTYTPPAEYSGADDFDYTVCDDAIAPLCDTATVTYTVTAENDAPTCQAVSITTNEDVQGSTEPNCNDLDGDSLTFEIVTQPTNGAASIGSLLYDPDLNFNGADLFTYRACDPSAACSGPADVSVAVDPVNDPPEAEDDSYVAGQGLTLSGGAPGVLDNDSDLDGDAITAALATGPASGTVALSADGSFIYTAPVGVIGVEPFFDNFTYNAIDTSLEISNLATVVIRVIPTCNLMLATIIGTSGPDVINGTIGNDVIASLAGNDRIDGLGGTDTVCAGPDDDEVRTHAGPDWVHGGPGHDTIRTNGGDDTVRGGSGDDSIGTGDGNDLVAGGDGDDTIRSGLGDDDVSGDAGDDILLSGPGADLVKGGAGNDTIRSGADDDTIFGDAGADMIRCGSGIDTADGGPDADFAWPDCETQISIP